MSCSVDVAECFHSNASESARGLKDFPVPAPMCKHTATPEFKQGYRFHKKQAHRTREGCSAVGAVPPSLVRKDTAPEPQPPPGE